MSAPHYEQTPIGLQAVIPGCEAREIPPTKLQARRRQADTGPLFATPAVDQVDQAEIAAEEENAGPVVVLEPLWLRTMREDAGLQPAQARPEEEQA
ncbi:MAG TPA: hypothetical protein VKA83_25850 [Methylomirabilota bacterium]|nr:hypothetical protein [Methylomirabilota bacterium]